MKNKNISPNGFYVIPPWIIYTRKLADTNFLEYKIEGEIHASPEACVSSFRQDIHHQADDPSNKKYPTYEIVNESKNSLLTYVIHQESFPFRNTEMSVRYLFSQNTENSTKEVRWEETWEEESVPPPSKNFPGCKPLEGLGISHPWLAITPER